MATTEIRSEGIGSLLRPAGLKEARGRREAGKMSAAALKQVEDRAVDEAIRLQEDAGLDVLTDGELRRDAFFGHLIDAVDAFDKFGGWATPFHDAEGGQRSPGAEPPVRLRLHPGGQPPHPRRSAPQALAGDGDGAPRLGRVIRRGVTARARPAEVRPSAPASRTPTPGGVGAW